MKIFYAVQATGNGHISRAMELLPHLREYGDVDIFLSGNNSHLPLDAPVKYRSKGLSLYYNCTGGLNYWEMLKALQPLRIRSEIRDLPVEKYDLVINDFDYITAAACARKKIKSVNFGHQASFLSSNAPRPVRKSKSGEWILRNFAKAERYLGLHFKPYDNFITTPVVKQEILNATPRDGGYITVYLPSWCPHELTLSFAQLPHTRFEIFCGQVKRPIEKGNIRLMPVDKKLFDASLINSSGIITGGGFETPAEALHLGKKIMTIPIRNQYEQQCNAAALEQMGVMRVERLDKDFAATVTRWLLEYQPVKMDYSNSIPLALQMLFANAHTAYELPEPRLSFSF